MGYSSIWNQRFSRPNLCGFFPRLNPFSCFCPSWNSKGKTHHFSQTQFRWSTIEAAQGSQQKHLLQSRLVTQVTYDQKLQQEAFLTQALFSDYIFFPPGFLCSCTVSPCSSEKLDWTLRPQLCFVVPCVQMDCSDSTSFYARWHPTKRKNYHWWDKGTCLLGSLLTIQSNVSCDQHQQAAKIWEDLQMPTGSILNWQYTQLSIKQR